MSGSGFWILKNWKPVLLACSENRQTDTIFLPIYVTPLFNLQKWFDEIPVAETAGWGGGGLLSWAGPFSIIQQLLPSVNLPTKESVWNMFYCTPPTAREHTRDSSQLGREAASISLTTCPPPSRKSLKPGQQQQFLWSKNHIRYTAWQCGCSVQCRVRFLLVSPWIHFLFSLPAFSPKFSPNAVCCREG